MSEETEEGTLEQRLQADFSKAFIAEQAPLAMGFCYIKHLALKNPLRAAAKTLVMSYRYVQYLFRSRNGKEDLHDVFSVYKGMPVNLLEKATNNLNLSPSFIEKADAHREEHNLNYCVVDIYTRDASCLVEAFIEAHKEELEKAGIRIGTVKGNHLKEREGRFTGNAETPILLRTKPFYLNPEIPYLTGKDEYEIYEGFLQNLVLV